MIATNIKWKPDGKKVDLPNEIEIPANVGEDEVAQYISDQTGFLHDGYDLETEEYYILSHEKKRAIHISASKYSLAEAKKVISHELVKYGKKHFHDYWRLWVASGKNILGHDIEVTNLDQLIPAVQKVLNRIKPGKATTVSVFNCLGSYTLSIQRV